MRSHWPSIVLLVALLVDPGEAANREFVLTSWSYTVEDEHLMWTADDWVVPTMPPTEEFAERPWQSHILAVGNATKYAMLSAEVLSRTGELLPTLWKWDAWTRGVASLDNSWATFVADYRALVLAFPHLPAAPWGVFLGDEPGMLTRNGLNQTKMESLRHALGLVKRDFPSCMTYVNFLYASFACPNPSYCCCNGRTGSDALAAALGKVPLDWLSSDEYYDVSNDEYSATYQTKLYPLLRPEQRVLLLPFAAYCEQGCAKNSSIAPGLADARCSTIARGHLAWAAHDERVAGFAIYRLKNLWRSDAQDDVCENLDGTGLGLVDKCASGALAMPETLAMWRNVTTVGWGRWR